MNPSTRRTAVVSAGVILGLWGAYTLFRLATSTTNCGGNSEALVRCSRFGWLLSLNEDGAPRQGTLRSLLPADPVEEFERLLEPTFNEPTLLLLRPDSRVLTNPRQVVIVSTVPYRNYPRPAAWNPFPNPFTHAVGYSDGSTELVSPQAFREIQLDEFVGLEEWLELFAGN